MGKNKEGKLEEKLNERGGIFYSMLENSPVGVVLLQEGVIKFLNRASIELTGYNPEELKDKKFEHFIHPEDRNMIMDRYKARIKGKDVTTLYEMKIVRKDGAIIPIEVNNTIINHGDEKATLSLIKDITQHKQVEDRLMQSEKKLEAIFNHRFQLTGLLDPGGKVLMANKSVCDMAGVDVDEVLGKYLWELPHWSHSKELQLEVQNKVQLVIKGNPISFETTHIDAKGDIKDMEFSLTPVQNDNGDLLYIVPEGKDITERKQTEKELKESEKRFRTMVEQFPVAIHIFDPDGWTIGVNSALMKLWGFNEEVFQGVKEKYNILRDSGQIELGNMPLIKKAFKGEVVRLPVFEYDAPSTLKKLNIPGESKKRWVHPLLFPVKDENGMIKSVVLIIENITARKKSEEELKESEETYRNIFHNAQVGLYRTRIEDGKIIESNNQAAWMLGFKDRKEFIDKYVTSDNYVDAGVREEVMKKLKENGEVQNQEVRMYSKDRSIIWFKFSAKIYPDKGWLEGVVQDINDRKQKEEEILRLKNGLEIEVAKKTQELREKMSQLQRFMDVAVDRELRMKEISDENEKLKADLEEKG